MSVSASPLSSSGSQCMPQARIQCATTQGGPATATQILVYKVYYDGVKAADLGGSSAQSVLLMIIVIALTAVQFRFVERKVQY